jgi:DNA-binding transcriptional LysR family regulator
MLHSPGFAPPGLANRRISQDPLVLAVPGQSALASQAVLTVSDLLDQPLVIFPRRILPSLYDAIFAMYHASGRLPRVAQEAIQMQTIVNLVSAGLGVAWVPESVRQFQRPGVVYRSVPAGRPSARGALVKVPGCETSLVWPVANANPALARFMAFIDAESD